jgi:hypothetical protein
MENWVTGVFVFAVIALGVMAQAFASLLEHQRRREVLEVIKAALAAGREPPPELYDLLRKAEAPKAPWAELVVFTALAFGFWLAFAYAEGERRATFLVVAASMTVAALGCLGLALFKPGHARLPPDDKQ